MKSTIKPSMFFLFGLVSLSIAVHAEIVSVNFQQVFEQYRELKLEDQKLRAQVADFQQEQQVKVQALQLKQQAFNQMRNQAAQPEVTEDQRKEIVKEATTQLEELNQEEQALRQERTQFQKDLEAKGLRLRRGIVDKVNEQIETFAEEEGWEIVVDASAKSPNGLPVLAYISPAMDKTQWVIAELNKASAVKSEETE
jgi:Skp family chaperone for outer membrane proteins